MLAASKLSAAKQRGGILKWMVTVVATLIIGKAVWDTAFAAPPSGAKKASSTTKTTKKKSAGGGGDKYLYEDEPNVIEVTSEEGFFQTSQKPRIVEFYSPYCGHCRNFRLTYVKAAEVVHAKYGSSAVEFYGVSCLAHHALCAKYEANSYPTVLAMMGSSNEGKKVGQMFFGLSTVEKALDLSEVAKVVQ